ncbi:T9SS C-terminal target domain-containing protein [Rhodohalobacter sp. SW132]|uniref:T9SS type A sorting domain-containing protein n=1 Tax=Rhodohalobacter sp. SW132 TaxID=2293433 RepID=UPI000E283C79|nr:T9SS type A sorting domain-containing protein [Rhodohalobacter sp. SW132]REL29173.1 T9SS C-terminal target domain-containing protein [Rhodohalobacter sp. SW132]
MKKLFTTLGTAALLILFFQTEKVIAQQYQIKSWSVGTGFAESGNQQFTVRHTNAQPLAGLQDSQSWSLQSGFHYISAPPALSTSSEIIPDELPAHYSLGQNYPNPFNPTTQIRFGLPSSSEVSLEVFDLIGRRVALLLHDEIKTAGYHHVPFDASALSSGIYLYRIQARNTGTNSGSSFVETRKMTLIK